MTDDSDAGNTFGNRFLAAAKAGDWEALAGYLERGFPINPAIRKFLVALLRGEVSRPKKRPISGAIRTQHMEIAAYAFDLKQKDVPNFVRQTADFFKIDTKAVTRAIKSWPQMNKDVAAFALAGSPRIRRLRRGH